MGSFWLLLSKTLTLAILAYGAIIAASTLDLPWHEPHFDTGVTNSSEPGWVNESRYFMLNKTAFAAARDRIVILGASTSRDPFRPALMEAALPGWDVENASLSGANISEIADAVDVFYDERTAVKGGRTVFVFALSYLQFKPARLANGTENPFATEAQRGSLYARVDGRLLRQLPHPAERIVLTAFRPQAVVASWPRRVGRLLFGNPDLPLLKALADRLRSKDPLSRWTQAMGEARDLNELTPPPDMQRALLAQRLSDGGDTPYPDDEFRILSATLANIRSHGDMAVIVDLPLPAWHRAGVPRLEAANDVRLSSIVGGFGGDPGVRRISLRAYGDDSNFFDSGHTKPKMWPVLSAALAADLRPLIADPAAFTRSHR